MCECAQVNYKATVNGHEEVSEEAIYESGLLMIFSSPFLDSSSLVRLVLFW